MKDVLGNYFDDEVQSAVKELIHANPGLTRSEPTEAMNIEARPPLESVSDTQDQPMETEQSEPFLGTFQPELGMPSYNTSLIRGTDSPPSPIKAKDNALLDADLDAPSLAQSKAPGAGRPEVSPKFHGSVSSHKLSSTRT